MNAVFDRQATLAELLPGTLPAELGAGLECLLGAPVALLDADGSALWGAAAADAPRYPLAVEIDPLGFVATAAPAAAAGAAAGLLKTVLRTRAHYLMAATLHTEAMSADHAELVRQNEALAVSEARYRELAEQLEARVEAQAATLEQRQRQLYQAEKLASVAQLAAGVAHEINNPIGFVRSNLTTLGKYLARFAELKGRLAAADAAWRELDLDFVIEDGADLLGDCIGGIDRVARIVADLKGFSNVDKPDEAMADVNDCLRTAVAVIAHKKPPGVELRLDAGELPPLLCLPGHLNQVFLNILDNALQAVDGTGTIDVQSRLEGVGGDAGIVVRIRDDGVGIDPHDLARVFDPFFTTRPVGRGTGLGLTVARDIVQIHDGEMAVDSQPGQGTLVTVRLPL